MDEYIKKELAIKALSRGEGCENVCRRAIERIIAADVAPARHGRWENYDGQEYLVCSECRDVYIYKDWLKYGKWNYCHNCGCKMDLED